MENLSIVLLVIDLLAFLFFLYFFVKTRKMPQSNMYKISRDYMITTGIIAAILAYFAFVQ